MAKCWIDSTTNPVLKQYIDKYGQAKGLKEYLDNPLAFKRNVFLEENLVSTDNRTLVPMSYDEAAMKSSQLNEKYSDLLFSANKIGENWYMQVREKFPIGSSAPLNKSDVIELKGNEITYEHYNLLNKNGKIKEVDPDSQSTKDWVKTLNLSPNFSFQVRQSTDGNHRIFVMRKLISPDGQTTIDFYPDVSRDMATLSPAFQKLRVQLEAKIRDKQRTLSKTWTDIKSFKRELAKAGISAERKQILEDKLDAALITRLDLETGIGEIEYDIDILTSDPTGENSNETAQFLLDVANKQLSQIQNILGKPTISSEQLKEVGATIDIWRNIKSVMFKGETNLNEEMINALNAIQNRADSEDIFQRWWTLVGGHIIEMSNENKKLLPSELTEMSDISTARMLAIDASQSGNRLVQQIDLWLRGEMFRAQTEVDDTFKKIDEMFEGMTNFDWLFKQDSAGKYTGGLVTRYSSEYDEALAKAKSTFENYKENLKNAGSSTHKAYKDFMEWKKDNMISIDFRFFTDPKHKTAAHEDSKSYFKYLVDQLGEKRAEELRDSAVEKYQKYLDSRTILEEDMHTQELAGIISHEEYSNKLRTWINFHSPIVYLDQLSGERPFFTQSYNGYVREVPVKTDEKGRDMGYYSPEFQNIENDPKLNEVYNYIRELMYEQKSYLPNYLIHELGYNFLPQVKKDLVDGVLDKSVSGIVKGLHKSFIEGITSEEGLDKRFVDVDPYTKKPYKQIPTRFLRPLAEEDMSRNMPAILKAFSQMALTYKYKSKVEDKVLLAQRILDNAEELRLNSNGDVIKNKAGDNLVETKDGLPNLKALTSYTINAILYNEKKNDEGTMKKKLFDSEVERKRYKELEKERDIIEEKLFNGEITEEQYDEQMQPLIVEAQGLGRNLVFSKIGDKLLRYNQALTLGLNVFSGINNWIFGVVSNLTWASSNKDFSQRDVINAFGLVSSSALNLKNKKLDKISNLASRFDIIGDAIESQYGETKSTNKTMEKLKNFPYILLRSGDFFIKATTMTSLLLSNKIKDKNGKERTLLEAFNNDGTWNVEEFGDNKDWGGDIRNSDEMKEFIRFKNKVVDINKTLHGNFDPNSPQMAKKWILGRMLGQFRLSWAATGIESRFGGKRYSDVLERTVEGRYRSYSRLGFNQSLKVLFNLSMMKGDKAFDGIRSKDIELIKENMRKNLMEIYMYSAMFTLYLLLKAAMDDDDDMSPGMKITLNTLNRVMGDTTFYFSPATFDQILNRGSIIPVFNIYKNFQTAKDQTMKYMQGDDNTDKEDVINAWGKNLPYWSQYYKIQSMGKKLQ